MIISERERLRSVFIIPIILLGLCQISTGQDTITSHLQTLSTDSIRLNWLSTEMNKAVLSSPQQTILLAALYDSIANNTLNDIDKANALNFQGMSQYANGDYESAARSYLKSISLFETTTEKKGLGIVFNNLASCYSFRKESLKSIEYYLKALDIATEIKDSARLALLNNNIGIQYVDMEEYETASNYYNKAIELYKASDQPLYVGITLLSRGNLYIEIASYNKAISDYNKAMELVPEQVVPLLHAASIGGIGTAYNRLGVHKKGEAYLLTSLEKAQKINHTAQIKESYRELSDLYNSTGRYKKSLDAYKNYTSAKDSLYSLEQDKNLIDALSKYEAEKSKKEIVLLNSQNEISQLKLEAANRRTLFISLVLGIFGLVSFLLFRLYKKIQSQNTIISKALSEKETLLKEIHHRVKNNLQFISSLLGLQTEHVSDKVALGALQEGQDRVQSMALIHQNLYQEDNLKGVDMGEYFTKLVRGLFDSYNIRRDQVTLEMEVEDLNLDVDSVIPIGLVVNELVSNSLKYAFPEKRKGIITVALKESNDRLRVTVKDDGIGISQNQINSMGTSFGYRLINVFKDQMQAELAIDGSKGTQVDMVISKYKKNEV